MKHETDTGRPVRTRRRKDGLSTSSFRGRPLLFLILCLWSASAWAQAYPNPTTGHVTIEYEGDEPEVSLYDILGRRITEGRQSAGVYFYRLSTGETGSFVLSQPARLTAALRASEEHAVTLPFYAVGCIWGTGSNHVIALPGQTIPGKFAGATLKAYTPRGDCAGEASLSSENLFVAVWGTDEILSLGFRPNESIKLVAEHGGKRYIVDVTPRTASWLNGMKYVREGITWASTWRVRNNAIK